MARWLHSSGVNIRAQNDDAFISSCANGELAMATWLHSLGADINSRNNSAFISSCENGKLDVSKWLYRLGVNILAQNYSALRLSRSNGYTETCTWLESLTTSVVYDSCTNPSILQIQGDPIGLCANFDDQLNSSVQIKSNNNNLVIYIPVEQNGITKRLAVEVTFK